MKNEYRFILSFLCYFLALTSYAQLQDNMSLEKFFLNEPDAKAEYEESENRYQEFLKKSNFNSLAYYKSSASSPYIIPVVFHVYSCSQHGKPVNKLIIDESLAQVNDDFNGRNDDFNSVNIAFQNIKSTLDIEFVLARLDPNGNPTTGIVYHPYAEGYALTTNNSNIINDSWDNYKYLNVYIQDDINANDNCCNSGTAWLPSSSMSNAGTARVVYNGQYLTGNTSNNFSSILTHEFGHWLNLLHTFEGGCSNSDGVSDTPADNTDSPSCSSTSSCSGGPENYENYMDYSDCYKMFTADQVTRMKFVLDNHNARKTLWQPSNLIATGTHPDPQTPIAYFHIDQCESKTLFCESGTINFFDGSIGIPNSWTWTFTSKDTSFTSNEQNPSILFNKVGKYNVKLNVQNTLGSNSYQVDNMIVILSNNGIAAPYFEDFETGETGSDWFVENENSDTKKWELSSTAAFSGNKSLHLNNFLQAPGIVDAFITPTINIEEVISPSISFKYAFAKRTENSRDVLKVYLSKNCGLSWFKVGEINASDTLATAPNLTSSVYVPADKDWKSFFKSSLLSIFKVSDLRVKFEFTSGQGNDIYIDDINIQGALSVDNTHSFLKNISIYPNPITNNSILIINLIETINIQVELYDLLGKKITTYHDRKAAQGQLKIPLELSQLTTGVYFIRIFSEKAATTKKIIVE